MTRGGLIERYGPYLEIDGKDRPVSLHEGATPLIEAPRLAEWVAPGARLFLKYEGLNPTGSFKDRGMVTAVTHARANGAESVVCASTGNTAASAAAYAARAGMRCVVLIPDGKIALGKLAGSIAYGAQVVAIDGNFDDALQLVRGLADKTPIALVNSVNPARLQGQQTAAWEVVEDLGQTPDWLCLPVGNAGNISAYWMGFCNPLTGGMKHPRLLGAQAAGAAPLLAGHPIPNPETKATAIRIGNPARWHQALDALKESCGHLTSVTDEEIFTAYREVARREGVFCEPSSAAGLAGLRKAVLAGEVQSEGQTIVCVLTGHGLKDPASATEDAPPITRIAGTLDALMEAVA